ncbi:MAG: PEP-CTERM sorting domain-containing protein [Planctomycetota bacterium]
MNKFLVAGAASLFFANSVVLAAIVGDTTSSDSNYEIAATPAVDIGGGLVATTLSVSNVSGDSGLDIIGFSNVVIGSNGNAHNIDAFGGFATTPFLQSFNSAPFDAGDGGFDTHFIQPSSLDLPGQTPVETAGANPSGVSLVSPQSAGNFGGQLTGGYSFTNAGGAVEMVDFARIVFDPMEAVDFAFNVGNAAGEAGSFTGTVVFPSMTDDPMLVGTPDAPGPIDLTPEFNDFSNFRDDAIVLSNGGTGELGAITLTEGGDNPELFVPTLDGLNIDIGLDLSSLNLSSILPNTTFTSTLNVAAANDGDGDLLYTLSVTVPEPSTVGLFSLALVGLAGLRRRG